MHTLIVTAHPDENAYTHAVVGSVIKGLKTSDENTYEVADLTVEGFNPCFTKADNDVFNGRALPDAYLIAEQQRIEKADVILFIFPVYWWSLPAVMKGWVDRVFSQGWAYKYDVNTGTTRMLTGLKGKVIATAGTNRATIDRRGYLDAMKIQFNQGIFGFCGMQALDFELLLPLDEQSRKEELLHAFNIGKNLLKEANSCPELLSEEAD